MTPDQHIKQLKSEFSPILDSVQYGTKEYWTIMKDGRIQGDCEDFALTLKIRIYGSILKGYLDGARIVFCRYRDTGHAIYQEPEGMYADNIQPSWFDKDAIGYKGFSTYWLPTVYIKMGVAKIYSLIAG